MVKIASETSLAFFRCFVLLLMRENFKTRRPRSRIFSPPDKVHDWGSAAGSISSWMCLNGNGTFNYFLFFFKTDIRFSCAFIKFRINGAEKFGIDIF